MDDLDIPLTDRAGRKTLSAEDLLNFALNDDAFEPFAIFGVAGCESEPVIGEHVRELLVASFESEAAT